MENIKEEINELKEYREKLSKLSEEEEVKRNIYLKKIQTGEIQGPPIGKLSLDKNWLKKYTDKELSIKIPHMKIYDYMMKDNLNHFNDKAIVYFGKSITYKKLDKKINAFARSLKQDGIKKGDIITVCMPNTPEAIIAFYAINKIGAIANMIHPLSGQQEIKNYLREVNSKMIITIDSSYNKITNIADETNLQKIVLVSPADSMPIWTKMAYKFSQRKNKLTRDIRAISWDNFIKNGSNYNKEIEEEYEKNRTAVILHTGGTTGIPKGVELTDDNFNSMVEQFLQTANNFERNDRMLTIMPVFHGFGLCSSVHLPLSAGVMINLIPKLNSKKLDKLITKYKPNHIIGVPTLFKGIINNKKLKKVDLSFLKYVVSGGDLVKDSLENDINDFLKEHNSSAKLSKGYGLSEAVAGATFAYNGYNNPTSVGIPMVATNLKIVKSGTNIEVENGEIGEICLYGPSIMKGYYHNETETNSSIKNGWLHTGDLGYYENDSLYFAQRKGNMIISSGVNVYPSNIEEVIEKHDSVSACAVIGIYHPYKIQVPKAYIVLKEGYELTDELKKEIENLCKKNLNVYSVPYRYEFRDKLPQTLLGKINKKELEQGEKSKTR